MLKTLCAVSIALFAMSAQASEPIDWSGCAKEVKEYSCTGDDKAVWSCLEKEDEHLGESCQAVHAKADELFKE